MSFGLHMYGINSADYFASMHAEIFRLSSDSFPCMVKRLNTWYYTQVFVHSFNLKQPVNSVWAPNLQHILYELIKSCVTCDGVVKSDNEGSGLEVFGGAGSLLSRVWVSGLTNYSKCYAEIITV